MTTGEAGLALEAIVLAAGAGARFGGAKLSAPWRDGRLIDGALRAAFAAPARHVWLVTGADRDVAGAAGAFAQGVGQAGRLRLAHAADHALGMAASLKAGLAALPPDAAGAFVFLGDMPRVPPEIGGRLAEVWAHGAAAAAPTRAGQRGHPVLFGAELFGALAGLEGDRGARVILDGLGPRLALVESVDDGVLFDVDRPGDLEA